MKKVGGNTRGTLRRIKFKTNNLGINEADETDTGNSICDLNGHLDLLTGGAKLTASTKILEESTHVFVCEYIDLVGKYDLDIHSYEGLVLSVNGINHKVTYIDDPMWLHAHLEVFLKVIL